MRKRIGLLTTILVCVSVVCHAQQNAKVTPSGIGYLERLPDDYQTTTKTYPLLIFLHGSGEVGNGTTDLSKVKANGPPKLIEQGHKMCFDGECFIVISPQLPPQKGGWWVDIQKPFYDYILANYRVDLNRVYVTGLSMGGQGTYIAMGECQDIFAAGGVVCGYGNNNASQGIYNRQVPVWGFHGDADGTISYGDGFTEFKRTIWKYPIEPKMDLIKTTTASETYLATPSLTLAEYKWTRYFNIGHNAWDNAYRTDNSLHTPNLYQWLLTKKKGVVPIVAPPVVVPPVVVPPVVGPPVVAKSNITVDGKLYEITLTPK